MRATRSSEHYEGRLAAHSGLQSGDDRLTRRHSERASHEVKILDGDRDHLALKPANAELYRILQPGLCARILKAIRIPALVAKLERIERDFRQDDIFELSAIEHRFQAHRRADAHVVVRARDDELVRFHILVKDELACLRAFDPEIFRRLATQEAADFRPDDVGDPVHGPPI